MCLDTKDMGSNPICRSEEFEFILVPKINNLFISANINKTPLHCQVVEDNMEN